MNEQVTTYDEAYRWVNEASSGPKSHLLLGNGFSVAYDRGRFSYSALLDHARQEGVLSPIAEKFFSALGTYDFEVVIRQLSDAANALEVLDGDSYRIEIEELRREADGLKEVLASTLAALHPERPTDVLDEAYTRVRAFINRHGKIYTANYDLLLYWALMHDDDTMGFTLSDDGFRSPDHDAPYVVWNHLNPHSQNILYLHGALHLYRDAGNAQLQKLTWIRTDVPLIDQIREQLRKNRFPLIVAEGTSQEKLAKIQTSDYLSKGLRSLAQIGGGILAYGLSFGSNDAHISQAIVNSKVSRIAVSIYGDPSSGSNQDSIIAVNRLTADRHSFNSKRPLAVRFYDAESVPLW
ncbi:DUF4917 family protein [Dietzia sp. SLG310A2-38A2]|uniref:DUF4917 family protein n=1 Tax=Dietzia sp. SLG310A2-38A2 TaxID=1630643 RepID=UPI0015F9783A|nr:DUF4917 family protein [Dietzia sp. SLG310A2-38A2]MBB1032610.1 DUF4917 family protein [Dietzia sp. SLG310A2-38A2]